MKMKFINTAIIAATFILGISPVFTSCSKAEITENSVDWNAVHDGPFRPTIAQYAPSSPEEKLNATQANEKYYEAISKNKKILAEDIAYSFTSSFYTGICDTEDIHVEVTDVNPKEFRCSFNVTILSQNVINDFYPDSPTIKKQKLFFQFNNCLYHLAPLCLVFGEEPNQYIGYEWTFCLENAELGYTLDHYDEGEYKYVVNLSNEIVEQTLETDKEYSISMPGLGQSPWVQNFNINYNWISFLKENGYYDQFSYIMSKYFFANIHSNFAKTMHWVDIA